MKLTCRESARLLSTRMDRPLSGKERIALGWHLMICLACRRFDKQMDILRRAMEKWRERI